ncbi:hypothetical protein NVP1187O_235 [Vibrio phage 1.187.O._10N.286.49.F1]|nr:hypothetical protein NVP1187O_235 [Vibrio phage 1.187.O._10N.286.49.F1]
MNNFIEMYLDWVNNFLSVEAFAAHYGISVDLAILVIKEGRILHELNCSGWAGLDIPKQQYFDNKMSW